MKTSCLDEPKKPICLSISKASPDKIKQPTDEAFLPAPVSPPMSPGIPLSPQAYTRHISEAYFRTLLKDYTGITPSQFKMNAKINRAKQCPANENMPLSESASYPGFNKFSYFCKVFKEKTACTPPPYQSFHVHQAPRSSARSFLLFKTFGHCPFRPFPFVPLFLIVSAKKMHEKRMLLEKHLF